MQFAHGLPKFGVSAGSAAMALTHASMLWTTFQTSCAPPVEKTFDRKLPFPTQLSPATDAPMATHAHTESQPPPHVRDTHGPAMQAAACGVVRRRRPWRTNDNEIESAAAKPASASSEFDRIASHIAVAAVAVVPLPNALASITTRRKVALRARNADSGLIVR